MYVCVCRGVTEKQIHEAVKSGAQRLRDLRLELGVTEECGRCAVCAKTCLQSALGEQGHRPPIPARQEPLHPHYAMASL